MVQYMCECIVCTYICIINVCVNIRTWFLDARLSDVYGVDTHLNSSQLIQSGALEFSISDDYMFAVKDHVS